MSWRTYQSVLSSDVFATTTSRRTPSTSCAYQRGNVSLPPTVTSTPYGSTEFNRSAATLRVDVCLARDAEEKFPNSGTNASSATGDDMSQLRYDSVAARETPSFPDATS